MSDERVEQKEFFVGDLPFGLVEKDAKFARWDARKSLKYGETSWKIRRRSLFESTTNDDLLDRMGKLHSVLAGMEEQGLTRAQILQKLSTDDPNLSDYDLLLFRVPWGERLIKALYRESYERDEKGELWDEFVMGRIHRALDGELKKFPRYDGRYSFQIETGLDILYFNPESNAHLNDGPEIHIRGNRVKRLRPSGFDTDQKFSLDLDNITRIQICEREQWVKFIKVFPGSELQLSYKQRPIGSTNQIELKSLATNSSS